MLAELYVLSGRDAGKVVDAGQGPTIFLGRAATNHLRIRDPQASRVHCRIDVTTQGLTLQDASSGNGTYVNGERVSGEARPLDDGDEIQIGSTKLKILIETEEDRRLWNRSQESASATLDGSGAGSALGDASGIADADADADAEADGSAVARDAVSEPAPQAEELPPQDGKESDPAADDRRPKRRRQALREVIPGYLLEARLGGHSHSGIAVYRASQESLGRSVALKVFLRRGPTRKSDVERFLREAKVIARLPHPNIVTIHDVIGRGKMRAIVMEYLAGGSLADRLDDGTALSVEEMLTVGEAVGSAIAYLHAHGVVHRGVKPSNILLAREHSTYKLAGFGFATGPNLKRYGDTNFMDSPLEGFSYLAPEQLQEDPGVDARSDVYALGASLFACAAGAPPFEGEGLADLGAAILRDEPPPLPAELPDPLRTIIERAMLKDPDQRYPDGTALLHELRACRAALELPAPQDRARGGA